MYQLKVNGQTILSVDVERDDWLPVRPQPNPQMLRYLVASALRNGAPTRTPTVISGFGGQRSMQLSYGSKRMAAHTGVDPVPSA